MNIKFVMNDHNEYQVHNEYHFFTVHFSLILYSLYSFLFTFIKSEFKQAHFSYYIKNQIHSFFNLFFLLQSFSSHFLLHFNLFFFFLFNFFFYQFNHYYFFVNSIIHSASSSCLILLLVFSSFFNFKMNSLFENSETCY